MSRSTTSRALERLNTLLWQDGTSVLRAHEGALPTLLHTDKVSISLQGKRFRDEHVDGAGGPTRCLLLALERIEDVVRLVAVYETPRPGRDT